MNHKMTRILPILALVVIGLIVGGYWISQTTKAKAAQTVSGTMEAVEVHLAAEVGGQVVAAPVATGQTVQAGDVLLQLDDSLLVLQRSQAEAALTAAKLNAVAAESSAQLLAAGPSVEQLATAQAVIDQAQVAVSAAQATYDALPELLQDTTDGQALKLKLDMALAARDVAQAQYDQLAAGARPEQIASARAQAAAAGAQADAAEAALALLDLQISRLTLTAPVDGVVLERTIELGELAVPGATLFVIGQLDELTLTIFVPEDRYGGVALGQTYTLTVDSFPEEQFTGEVIYIADTAEFTPRNVQTAQSRRNTVYAIKLALPNTGGRLKPGMPADVLLGR
jgi:HlyD family secretion protein